LSIPVYKKIDDFLIIIQYKNKTKIIRIYALWLMTIDDFKKCLSFFLFKIWSCAGCMTLAKDILRFEALRLKG
jgi:hypothetical protein